jgi:exopolyphosphatase/guanosine-5'-triphosphate,3'-diphosphate pyrophosphatase
MPMSGTTTQSERPLTLDYTRFIGREKSHVAVVDVGSNSVRLVVYDQLGRSPFPRFNEKSLCRLGAGQGDDGSLAPDAIDRTLRAVERFFAISKAMAAERIDVLATAAVRGAPHGKDQIDSIRERCGAETRLLSGKEEAYYSALGVIAGIFRPRGLMGDIGGGSLEIAEVLDDRPGERSVSLPLGALPVTALLADSYGSAKKRVDEMLEAELPPMLTEPVFYAVGGGFRALATIQIARSDPLSKVVHGFEMETKEARALAKEVSRASPAEIASLPEVPSRRIDTLPAAALVLDRVLRALKPERVVFSALGLREGWLYSLLSEEEKQRDPLLEGAQAFGTPLARVPAFAGALMRWTDRLFPAETAEDRRLRLAACALSDIGWRDHPKIRAEECCRRVLELPFVGVTHPERAYLAAALHSRHNGKPDDVEPVKAKEVLGQSALRRAHILGRALQLGYRFSGSVPAILDQASLEIDNTAVRVVVRGRERVPDSDAVQTRLSQLAKALGVAKAELTYPDP